MNKFTEFWKGNRFELPRFEKEEKLSRDELTKARELIGKLRDKGIPAHKIITRLSKDLGIDQYDASRVFWTESKRADVVATRQLGKEIGITKYRVILSPNACKVCIEKTDHGRKIFSQAQVTKSGYGQFVPWHPNCFCIVVPMG